MNQSYFLLVFVLPTVFDENKKIRQAAECYAEIHAGDFQYSCSHKEWTLTGKCYNNYARTIAVTCFTKILYFSDHASLYNSGR